MTGLRPILSDKGGKMMFDTAIPSALIAANVAIEIENLIPENIRQGNKTNTYCYGDGSALHTQ